MNFPKIDRAVRFALATLLGGVVVAATVCCAQPANSPPADSSGSGAAATGTFRTTNLVVDDLAGIGTTTPAQELDVSSSDQFCSGANHSCLPVQVTEYLAAAPSITFRRALGDAAAPTPITADGQCISQFRESMYTTTGFQGLPQVFSEVCNAEPTGPTATSQGVYWDVRTVAVGSTSSASALKVDSTGNVATGLSFDSETVPFGFIDLTSVAWPAIIQPTALASNATVNDYSPTDTLGPLTMQNTFALRVFCQGTNVITGMTDALGETFKGGSPFGQLGGREVAWINIGSGTCTFPSNNGGSVAKNRYDNPGNATLICPPGSTVNFFGDSIEDGSVGRWRAIGTTGCYYSGQAVIGATITTGNAGGPTWYSGTGAPGISCNIGDLYSRTDGSTSTTLYVCTGSNVWTAK